MIVCFLCALFIYLFTFFLGGGGGGRRCFSIYMGFKCVASIRSFNRGYEFMFVELEDIVKPKPPRPPIALQMSHQLCVCHNRCYIFIL